MYQLLKKDGWYPASQKGSHVKMKHPSKPGTVIFPKHGSKELGKGLEKQLLKKARIGKH